MTIKEIFRVTLISEVYIAAETAQDAADLANDPLAVFARDQTIATCVTRASEPRPQLITPGSNEPALHQGLELSRCHEAAA